MAQADRTTTSSCSIVRWKQIGIPRCCIVEVRDRYQQSCSLIQAHHGGAPVAISRRPPTAGASGLLSGTRSMPAPRAGHGRLPPVFVPEGPAVVVNANSVPPPAARMCCRCAFLEDQQKCGAPSLRGVNLYAAKPHGTNVGNTGLGCGNCRGTVRHTIVVLILSKPTGIIRRFAVGASPTLAVLRILGTSGDAPCNPPAGSVAPAPCRKFVDKFNPPNQRRAAH